MIVRSRRVAMLATIGIILGTASSAWALDAWRDRRGLFLGGTLGFGSSEPDTDGADSNIGFNARGRVGGGMNKHLTLDAELGLHAVTDNAAKAQLWSGFAAANIFVIDGVYLRGMGGVSYFSPDTGSSETGLGVGAGVGFEFFANADLAVGGLVDIQEHFFDAFDFRVISFGVTVTRY